MTIDDDVLFAPCGAKVTEDGKAVFFPGFGSVRLHSSISGAGGTLANTPSGGDKCRDRGEDTTFVSLDPRD